MTKFKKQIFAILTAGAILVNSSTAFAATEITISGNGAESDNYAKVNSDNNTSVVQDNTAVVTNNIKVDADTGDNKANDNGGEEVSIETGDATAKVTVANDLNTNVATVDCCPNGDTQVKISGNLRDSDNTVKLDQDNNTALFQTNTAVVDNNVDVDADTGDNKANDNLGGSVSIDTGDASTKVILSTSANRNVALVGGGDGDGEGSLSAWIVDNGADTDNHIKLDMDRNLALLQDNVAVVSNDVDVDADTGYNKANDNGGEVSIETGDADAKVIIDNLVNFNEAWVDCGCLLDVTAKIAGNLADSDNTIKAYLDDNKEVFQTNLADLYNDGDIDGDTGHNKANDNLSGNGDPSIDTGDTETKVHVENVGNQNSYGVDFDLPEGLSDLDLSFSFDLSLLSLLLGLS